MLAEGGMGTAIIRSLEVSQIQLSSAFYANLAISLVFTVSVILAAEPLAALMGAKQSAGLIQLMSVPCVITAAAVVPSALLSKQLDFKKQAFATLPASVLSGTVAISMALTGQGVASLIAQAITFATVRTVLIFLLGPWRPTPAFSIRELRGILNFSTGLFISGLIELGFTQFVVALIGKTYGAQKLGLYNMANQLQQLPLNSIMGVYTRVSFAAMSSEQNRESHRNKLFKRSLKLLSNVAGVAMGALFVGAHELVSILLGERWQECGSYIQIMCLIGLVSPLHVLNLDLIKLLGHVRLFLKLELLKKIIGVLMLAATWGTSLKILVTGQLAVSVICVLINCSYAEKLAGLGLRAQLNCVYPAFLSSIIASLPALGLRANLEVADGPKLIAVVSLYLASYLLLACSFNREFKATLILAKKGISQKASPN